MESINVKVPKYQKKIFGDEGLVKRNKFVQDMKSAIAYPPHTTKRSQNIKLLKTFKNRNVSRFGNYYTRPSHFLEEEEEEIYNPMNLFTNQQRPWFTIVPLGVYRPEEVTVKLNPVCHLLVIKTVPSMQRTPLFRGVIKPVKQIITLPKTLQLKKLKVKLNQRGELLVIAPFKYTQGRQSFEQQEQIQNTFVPPYFQEEKLQWTTLPITTYQLSARNVFGKQDQQQSSFYPYQGESDTSSTTTSTSTDSDETTTSTDTETDTDTDTESESENEEYYSSNVQMYKVFAQKYVSLLKKIFSPNIVIAKIVPVETTKYATSQRQHQQMQLIFEIKFVHFRSEEIKVRLHDTKPSMLIVEGKKTCQLQEPVYINAVKYARREFMVPKWLDVNYLFYRVLPNGVLRIKVPFLTKNISSTMLSHGTQVGLHQTMAHRCLCNTFVTKPMQGQQTQWKRPQRYL
jgi:virulence-associated protein VagC